MTAVSQAVANCSVCYLNIADLNKHSSYIICSYVIGVLDWCTS